MEKRYCAICGKEITAVTSEGIIRRNAKYCSDKCRNKARVEYSKKYVRERYKTDEEFRKRRTARTSYNAKLRRDALKADAIERIAKHIRTLDSDEEAAKYLMKTVKVKTEYAYGSKAL